jgi:hypothetical protein
MFWNKKKKLPITIDDKEWIENSLLFLRRNFGTAHFDNLKTITPTKNYYNINFKGNEEDAEFILKRTMEIMSIEDSKINLIFFSDQPIEMLDGTIVSTPADIDGSWMSTAGIYEEKNDEKTIYIERSQLKNTISLIATISHELSHLILLGENRIEENDEYLTDLTAIAYGFGIFIGNSKFQHTTFQNSGNFGWQMTSQGYLPEQIIAYSMVWLSKFRNETTEYKQYLNKSMTKYFIQSEEYLHSEK